MFSQLKKYCYKLGILTDPAIFKEVLYLKIMELFEKGPDKVVIEGREDIWGEDTIILTFNNSDTTKNVIMLKAAYFKKAQWNRLVSLAHNYKELQYRKFKQEQDIQEKKEFFDALAELLYG